MPHLSAILCSPEGVTFRPPMAPALPTPKQKSLEEWISDILAAPEGRIYTTAPAMLAALGSEFPREQSNAIVDILADSKNPGRFAVYRSPKRENWLRESPLKR